VETRLKRWNNSNRFGFRNVTCKDTPSFKQRGIDGIIISVVLCSIFQKELFLNRMVTAMFRQVFLWGWPVGRVVGDWQSLSNRVINKDRSDTDYSNDGTIGGNSGKFSFCSARTQCHCLHSILLHRSHWSRWIDCRGESHGFERELLILFFAKSFSTVKVVGDKKSFMARKTCLFLK
jgi:hypothetical protein